MTNMRQMEVAAPSEGPLFGLDTQSYDHLSQDPAPQPQPQPVTQMTVCYDEPESRNMDCLTRKLSQQSLKDLHEACLAAPGVDLSRPTSSSSCSQSISLDVQPIGAQESIDEPQPRAPLDSFLGSTTPVWPISRWLHRSSPVPEPPRNHLTPSIVRSRIRRRPPPIPPPAPVAAPVSAPAPHQEGSRIEACPLEKPPLKVDDDEGYDDVVDGHALMDSMLSCPGAMNRRGGNAYLPYRSSADAANKCRDLVHKVPRMRKRKSSKKKDLQRSATDAGIDDQDQGRTKRARYNGPDSTVPSIVSTPTAHLGSSAVPNDNGRSKG
ncbi:hypothetical protein B0I35DRAFT_126228 [Stachybotrys elegans]|uniref:Uncharacterized protein n=1 Tax=Stachybotrys elegans TaxID=80388 RepID=A0A8K0SZ74_9HYPO|nr:hypothetical protein B0I35DRAFT_126228 [Stachybotrys elegans]